VFYQLFERQGGEPEALVEKLAHPGGRSPGRDLDAPAPKIQGPGSERPCS